MNRRRGFSTKLSLEPVEVAEVISRFLTEARMVPIEPPDTAIAVDAFRRYGKAGDIRPV